MCWLIKKTHLATEKLFGDCVKLAPAMCRASELKELRLFAQNGHLFGVIFWRQRETQKKISTVATTTAAKERAPNSNYLKGESIGGFPNNPLLDSHSYSYRLVSLLLYKSLYTLPNPVIFGLVVDKISLDN